VTNWMRPAGLKRDLWPNLAAHSKRMLDRPAVRKVMEAEGLILSKAN
jgi:glutathione S-transferase